jgi:hypothetical protein|mmetsp:Transcript_18032/g.32697  ORF Transcript_18032/g.32697 Transcript_18032/m.32697 type:complete len:152 (-) Transcript_18032:58-513(-)|eukprot:CAMPEP_0198295260 /NCGR_PEP_ID=MMETSP1449-20131203/26806_1 /TAXON_ID=420275 /ORGANISM="Attheya septentrionalis, Strain CCMP2084" /LENGTH=151 /DNA_ID=CAMNT_0043995507 /DNA_START=210 /DNA_END=665 /DNA_ORIENTATION=-
MTKLLATFILLSALFLDASGFGTQKNSLCSSPMGASFFALENGDNNDDVSNNPLSKIPILGGIVDVFSNMDDVVDDFFNKRMGNGEIFYGKRKFKPSGTVEGDYNGMGLTDKLKIDITRDRKEEWLEEKKMREEIEELRRAKERRQRDEQN